MQNPYPSEAQTESGLAGSLLHHLLPLLSAGLALVVMLLAPLWAYDWYHQPFTGMLLEPTLVVSQISGKGWPAKAAGVELPDRLIAVNGQPISSYGDYLREIKAGEDPVQLTFETPDRSRHTAAVRPIHARLDDLVSLFIVPYMVGWAFLGIGIWVYRLRRRTRAGRAFLIFCAAVALTAGAFLDMNTTHHAALLWALSIPLSAGAMFYLALIFPVTTPLVRRYPRARFAPWLPALILTAPTITTLLAPGNPWSYFAAWKNNYYFTGLSILFFLGWLAYQALRSTSPVIRQQSRIIIFGSAFAFAPVVFFFIQVALGYTPQFISAIYFPFTAIFPLSVAYAIVRYRLLDVDRLLGRAVAYALTTGVVVTAYFALLNAVTAVLDPVLGANDPLINALFLLALVLALNPLRSRAQHAVDRVFYRTPVNFRRQLEILSRRLTLALDLRTALRAVFETLEPALHPDRILIYQYHEEHQIYFPNTREFPIPRETFTPDGILARTLAAAEKPLLVPDDRSLEQVYQADAPNMRNLSGKVYAPLRVSDRLTGFLVLGLKQSGDPYTGDELDFIAAVAAQSALALENARLFSNLSRNLDDTREMKILMDDIFASIASGVITTDLDDKITLFNRAAEKILGVPAGRILGMPYRQAIPELSARLEALVELVKEQDAAQTDHELHPVLPAKGPLSLRLSLSPLKDAHETTIGVTIVVDDLTRQREAEARSRAIRRTFDRVVHPRVVDRLLAGGHSLQLTGIRQEVTLLFADVRGFSSFSEETEPEALFTVLNSYLSLVARAVLAEEGTLDKFMGDAVMAFWNAPDPQPDHTLRAVRSALAMCEALDAHRNLLNYHHHLYFGVGIATGDAVVGNLGTSELFNYTAIGDTVNLARRLQETAHPGQILLAHNAYLQVANQVEVRSLEPVRVKGRHALEQVYEVVALRQG